MSAENTPSEFERSAREQRDYGFFAEFWYFLKFNKKWWLTPIVIIMLLLGVLMLLAGTGAAPFIYTLF
jgi:hypothetical protein